MRKCCCCVSVHAGGVLLGLLGVLLAAAELAVLVPYLMGLDPDSSFNPIEGNLDSVFFILEKMVKEAKNATSEVLDSLDYSQDQVKT